MADRWAITVDLLSRAVQTCQRAADMLHLLSMFEEGQLYSPVTASDDGAVTVHLADDHPGANDPDYRARRNEIAAGALAWKPGDPSPKITYSEAEQDVWRTVCRELFPKYEKYAIQEFREGVERLGLPR